MIAYILHDKLHFSESLSGSAIFITNTYVIAILSTVKDLLVRYPFGGYISTAGDMLLWNQHLHHGKLLCDSIYHIMTTAKENAVRDNPIFGITHYGYGITVDTTPNMVQLGQTGYAPGYVTMNYYFPNTATSVIILENIAYDTNDLKKTFHYHTRILDMIRDENSKNKRKEL